jgi:hypothetical protein
VPERGGHEAVTIEDGVATLASAHPACGAGELLAIAFTRRGSV